jgi:hypothetical protein
MPFSKYELSSVILIIGKDSIKKKSRYITFVHRKVKKDIQAKGEKAKEESVWLKFEKG